MSVQMFTTQFDRCPRVQFVPEGVSLTKQSFKDSCDINLIMKRYEKTGVLEHSNRFGSQYGDFTGFDDYQEAQQRLIDADEAFMSLPSKIRERFDNHPGLYFDFATNPDNKDELMEMGLLPKPEAPVSEPEIQK